MLAQPLQVDLVPSDHNGYAISCFGARDGGITVTVSGGTAPYTFEWSNGATTQNLSDLAAGYYKVKVRDSDTSAVDGEITLEQPERVSASADPYEYGNGYHVSCHSCYNGMISASATGGVAPYTYTWKDGSLQQNRSNLGARDYTVTVKDANDCLAEPITLTLREPERSDWTMDGNTGTDPAVQYLGTADSTDLVLRTNGQERIRIMSSGEVQTETLAFPEGYRLVWADSAGVLKSMSESTMDIIIDVEYLGKPGCPVLATHPWRLCGNRIRPENFIGSTNAQALRFKTDNEERMQIDAHGKVGIGTIPPVGQVDGYRLFVEDGISTRDVLVKLGTWPDYVFADGYRLMPLKELREFLKRNRHLPGIPSAATLEEQGGVAVGDMQRNLVRTVEEQALYILQLEERLGKLEQRLEQWEASDK